MQTRGSDLSKYWGSSGRSLCSQKTGWVSWVFTQDWTVVRCLRKVPTVLQKEPSPHTIRREPVALSLVLKNGSADPGGPSLPPLPHSVSVSPASLWRTAAVFASCPRSTEAWRRRRKVPQKQRFGVRFWGPEPRGLHLCFHKPVRTARCHLRLKADNRARSCGGSDSCWETSLGPNTPQLWSEG